MSLKVRLKKFVHKGQITQEEYDALIKKLDGHDKEIRSKAIDEFAEQLSAFGTYDYHGNKIDVLEIAVQLKRKYQEPTHIRCLTCKHYDGEEIVDNICYLCWKGFDDNYAARMKGE